MGEFFCLILENCDFAIYCNFCFINNLLLKIQNNVPLVLRRPLKSVVYDFAFNSILPFLVNFSILSSKLVISVNQGVRRIQNILGYYFLSIYMICSHQGQSRLFFNKIQTFCENSFSGGFQFITLQIQGTSHEFKFYYLETNSLVSVHQCAEAHSKCNLHLLERVHKAHLNECSFIQAKAVSPK